VTNQPPRRYRKGQRIIVDMHGSARTFQIVNSLGSYPSREGGDWYWIAARPVIDGEMVGSQHLFGVNEDGYADVALVVGRA